MSASRPQTLAIRHLWPSVERRLRDLGLDWFVGTDQTMLLDPDDNRVGVRPDLYVLPGQPAEPIDESWPAYLPGVPPPILAFEMVSRSNWGKDYHEAPQRYATLGTDELVLFDAGALTGRSLAPNPEPLQIYRRDKSGAMKRAYAGAGPAFCEVLRLWLVAGGDLLELSEDEEGTRRVMTPEEGEAWWKEQAGRQQAERRRAEQACEQAEKAQQQAEERATQEAAAREAAEQAREQAEQQAEQQAEAARQAQQAKEQAERVAAQQAEAAKAAEAARAAEQAAKEQAERMAAQQAEAARVAEAARQKAEAEAEALRLKLKALEDKLKP